MRVTQKVGGLMDWKEQLSTVVEESEIQLLDVRFICMKHQGKWFLKRLHVTVFHAEPSLPERVRYPSYLFLRQTMSSSDFLHLLSDLTTRLSAEELAKLTEEEKLKKFCVNEWDIWCEFVGVNFNVHAQGNSLWGLGEHVLPFWSFGGTIFPDLPENQEPLVAPPGVPYFPTPLDGQAWYLYGKALQSPNNYLPAIEISLEDDRAFFQDIVIDEKTSTLRCRCEGKLLSQATLRLYTKVPQIEEKPAEQEVMFQLQGQPTVISLALTYADIWLDRKEINFTYPQLGVPKGVNVIGRSFRPGSGLIADPAAAIEKIAQADPSNVTALAAPNLEIVNDYYISKLRQSQQSFFWALVGGLIGILFIIAAVLVLIFRLSGDASSLASIITAIGGALGGVIAGILLKLYGSTSDQAAAYHVRLDRIQRFFIANSACEHLENDRKGATREALIKKLSDL